MTRPDFADTDGEQGFVTAATVTLSNGDRVRSDSLMWKDECRKRHNHVMVLRTISGVAERRAYVAQVAKAEGNESGKRLIEAYERDFRARKAAAEAVGREAA